MRTFAIGDIHGNYKGLVQCLQRSKFDKENDKLIVLGDVCDRYPEIDASIDELLTIKNLVYVLGNHDEYFLTWLKTGIIDYSWVNQGGRATLICYNNQIEDVPLSHRNFLETAVLYHEENNQVFVHAGLDPNQLEMRKQNKNVLIWDRDLIQNARNKSHSKPDFKYGKWDEIWVGHTPTTIWDSLVPVKFCNVIGIDTGSGWGGHLTMVDVATKQFFQSDKSVDLYPSSERK